MKYKLVKASSNLDGPKRCAFFATEAGCRQGEKCKFAHIDAQGNRHPTAADNVSVSSESSDEEGSTQRKVVSKKKTRKKEKQTTPEPDKSTKKKNKKEKKEEEVGTKKRKRLEAASPVVEKKKSSKKSVEVRATPAKKAKRTESATSSTKKSKKDIKKGSSKEAKTDEVVETEEETVEETSDFRSLVASLPVASFFIPGSTPEGMINAAKGKKVAQESKTKKDRKKDKIKVRKEVLKEPEIEEVSEDEEEAAAEESEQEESGSDGAAEEVEEETESEEIDEEEEEEEVVEVEEEEETDNEEDDELEVEEEADSEAMEVDDDEDSDDSSSSESGSDSESESEAADDIEPDDEEEGDVDVEQSDDAQSEDHWPLPRSCPVLKDWQRTVVQSRKHPRFKQDFNFESLKSSSPPGAKWFKCKPYGAWCAKNPQAIAIDCEMCLTTNPVTGQINGKALCRISIVNAENPDEVLLDTLVKPKWPVTDYRTFVNGITKESLANVKMTLEQVQAFMRALCSEETIIVGHAVQNDLAAMFMEHYCVADSAYLFEAADGSTYSCSLKDVVKTCFNTEMPETHDSVNDARKALDCVMYYHERNGDVPKVVRTSKYKSKLLKGGNLFVHNIPKDLDKATLSKIFRTKCNIIPSRIHNYRFKAATGRARTFVTFMSKQHARLAFDSLPGETELDANNAQSKTITLPSGWFIRVCIARTLSKSYGKKGSGGNNNKESAKSKTPKKSSKKSDSKPRRKSY